MSERAAHRGSPAYLLLATAVLCWAGNFVLGRAVHSEIPPLALTFWRWAVAGAVLVPLASADVWRFRRPLLAHWRLLTVLAVSGVALFHAFVYTGLATTTATNAALIMATTPVVIPIVSYLLFREPLALRQGIGIAGSLAGVTLILVRGDVAALTRLAFTPGDLWVLAAVPTWALYSVLLRKLPLGVPRLAVLLAINGLGVALLAPAYAIELAWVGGIALTPGNLAAIAYVALFASVVAYICWNRGVVEVGATKAGLFLHLMPVFATALAVALLGERLHGYHLPGIALIAAGLYLTTAPSLLPRRRRR